VGREGRVAGEPRHHPHQIRIEAALWHGRLRFVSSTVLHKAPFRLRKGVRTPAGRLHGAWSPLVMEIGFADPATKHHVATLSSWGSRMFAGSTCLSRRAAPPPSWCNTSYGSANSSLFPRIRWESLAAFMVFPLLNLSARYMPHGGVPAD
jgi:hypothetical protein